MKKINFILSILLVLVFIGQIVIMLQPFFSYTPKSTLKERQEGIVKEPISISLEQFVFTEYVNMQDFLMEGLAKNDFFEGGMSQKEEMESRSNEIVIGVVGITVLGLVMAIMTIFTRKSTVAFCFTAAWALISLYTALVPSPAFALGTEQALNTLLPTLNILAYSAVGLLALRVYPWIQVRYIIPRKEAKERIAAYIASLNQAS